MPARTDIKDRIVTLLKSGGSGPAANRVYVGRQNVLPVASTDFPAIYVYMLREDVDTSVMGATARRQRRTMIVAVDYWSKVSTPEGVEDGNDTACATIEALIGADTDLNGKAEDIVLTSAEYIYDGTEDEPSGRAAMQFRVIYDTDEP